MECLNLDEDAFSSTAIDHKFNHHGYKSGYDITGDFFDQIKATAAEYDDPNARSNKESWWLGKYHRTRGNVMYYVEGSYCHPTGKKRVSTVTWTCGDKLEITKMIEPSTCVYEIEATKPCLTKKEPSLRIAKLATLFSEMRGLWFTPQWPSFSDRMQVKVEKLGQKMLDWLVDHRDDVDMCHEDGIEEPEATRYNLDH